MIFVQNKFSLYSDPNLSITDALNSIFRCIDDKVLQFIRHLEQIINDICLQVSTLNLEKADKLISLLATKARVVYLESETYYFFESSFSQFYNKYGEHLKNVYWFRFHSHRAHCVPPNLLNEVDFLI